MQASHRKWRAEWSKRQRTIREQIAAEQIAVDQLAKKERKKRKKDRKKERKKKKKREKKEKEKARATEESVAAADWDEDVPTGASWNESPLLESSPAVPPADPRTAFRAMATAAARATAFSCWTCIAKGAECKLKAVPEGAVHFTHKWYDGVKWEALAVAPLVCPHTPACMA